jgi:peptide/nickel transport system substrate-binding protein
MRGHVARGIVALAALPCACVGPSGAGPPLHIAIYDRPRSFDPHLESEFVSFAITSHVYEGLTRLDRDLKVAPALAERWESPDALRWRFRLRPGVRFHDGRPLAAEDVVASLERARRHPRSDWSSYLVAVDRVQALDPLTVEVATTRPYSLLLQKLAYVMVVPRDAPDEIERPVGTGAYRLLAPLSGRRLVLHAFESYWGPPPAETVVHFEIEPSLERVLRAPAAERADLVLAVGPQAADLIERTPGYSLVTRSGITTDYLQLQVSRPPFSDIRARRAVSLGLDRDALVRDALGGRGRPANQLVSPAVFGHDPSVPEVRRDVGEARRLLAEAGYGDGIRLELEFREGRRVAALVAQLAEIGIRARPRPQSYGALSARLRANEVAMYYGGAMASTGDASDLLDSLLHSRTPERGLGENNMIGYRNLLLDGLIESASRQSAMAERRATLQHCLRIALDDLPLVPLVSPEDIYGVREGIEWRPRLDGRVLGVEVRRAPRARAVAERRALLLE